MPNYFSTPDFRLRKALPSPDFSSGLFGKAKRDPFKEIDFFGSDSGFDMSQEPNQESGQERMPYPMPSPEIPEYRSESPAMTKYLEYLQNTPQASQYQQSTLGKILAAIAGFGAGVSSHDPSKAISVSQSIMQAPYQRAMEQWKAGGQGLAAGAELEQTQNKMYNDYAKSMMDFLSKRFGSVPDNILAALKVKESPANIRKMLADAEQSEATAGKYRAETAEIPKNSESDRRFKTSQSRYYDILGPVAQQNAGTNAERAKIEKSSVNNQRFQTAMNVDIANRRLSEPMENASLYIPMSQQDEAEQTALEHLRLTNPNFASSIDKVGGRYEINPKASNIPALLAARDSLMSSYLNRKRGR